MPLYASMLPAPYKCAACNLPIVFVWIRHNPVPTTQRMRLANLQCC